MKKVERIADVYKLLEETPINRYVGTHLDDIILKEIDFPLPDIYKELLSIIGDKGFLAGGAVRCLVQKKANENDFDVYSYTKENRKELVDAFINNDFKATRYNQNCVMLFKNTINVQIIFSFVGQIAQVIDEFDFTVCRIATDGRYIYQDKDFADNLKNNLLRIKTIQCPISSIRRVAKYAKKGFFITNFQILKLYEDFLNRPEEYKQELSELVKKQDKEKLSQEDLNELYVLMRM